MATIHYARTDEFARKGEKYDFLDQHAHVGGVDWRILTPDKRHTWLTEGMQAEFDGFVPLGTQETKRGSGEFAIFELYSNGLKTNRDVWVYNFRADIIATNVQRLIEVYNEHVHKLSSMTSRPLIDDFVISDPSKISWSDGLKQALIRHILVTYNPENLRNSLYRPFTRMYVYFDKFLNERRYQLPSIFPPDEIAQVNRIICVAGVNNRMPFGCFVTSQVIALDFAFEKAQCFPFYTYDEDGSNRRENITDWALEQFQARYQPARTTEQSPITKWDIFHYVYALLHHPEYRGKYAANLRRELPRIPFVQDFWDFVTAGRRLAEIHVNYEQQPEYPLKWIENQDKQLNWRVERMKLSRDKRTLSYNDFLTLDGIPPEVYEYKLGNRSALEWVIDQYKVSVDKRSGIANDPNNPDDPQYIVRLIGKVITVSLETVQIVERLPPLEIMDS